MSGSSNANNDSTLAGFLLSAGIVTPSATQNITATQGFLQQIGFCTSEAQTIALALKQQSLGSLGGSTTSSLASGSPIVVPTGWLGNVGSSKPLASLSSSISFSGSPITAVTL